MYESRIAENDSKMSLLDMMKTIELKYQSYVLMLDRLPQQLVYKSESQCYREEAKVMKIAELAAKKLVNVERMTKSLSRLLHPAVYRIGRGKFPII